MEAFQWIIKIITVMNNKLPIILQIRPYRKLLIFIKKFRFLPEIVHQVDQFG